MSYAKSSLHRGGVQGAILQADPLAAGKNQPFYFRHISAGDWLKKNNNSHHATVLHEESSDLPLCTQVALRD